MLFRSTGIVLGAVTGVVLGAVTGVVLGAVTGVVLVFNGQHIFDKLC